MTDQAMSPLRRRMIEDMTIRKFAPKTQHDYLQRVKNFTIHLGRSPDTASSEDVRRYQKAEFWKVHAVTSLNDRQRDILNRLVDGFEGKLTSSKWAKIEKCSTDTALRDINELVARGILARDEAGGRSTSYSLTEIKADG
jgi:predicted HTH transcriptional regulator